MSTTYTFLAGFAQTGGLVYFLLVFLAVVAYALRPRNRARFDDAARIPLSRD
jgi:cytochrome c oxidase cbb3-type subunit 4